MKRFIVEMKKERDPVLWSTAGLIIQGFDTSEERAEFVKKMIPKGFRPIRYTEHDIKKAPKTSDD